jgi:hypothetical protein
MSCAAAPGVIDEIARTVLLDGKVKGAARRALTPALAIRLTLLMTLMPDADYAEVMAALLGDLPLVPWQRPYQVPVWTPRSCCSPRWCSADGPDRGGPRTCPPGGAHRGLPLSIQRWNTSTWVSGQAPSQGMVPTRRRSRMASACALTSS